uniref:Putative intracellular cystatin n=1 Tax=Amblyomma aureolatum TaxID=187763 RepID=A0A1E1WX20_9ACAR
MAGTKVGGLSEELKEVDAVVQEICEKIRPDVENKLGQCLVGFEPINYRTQVVNGVNYFIKVHIGADHYIHIRAHKSIDGQISFVALQYDKSLEDELEHFN